MVTTLRLSSTTRDGSMICAIDWLNAVQEAGLQFHPVLQAGWRARVQIHRIRPSREIPDLDPGHRKIVPDPTPKNTKSGCGL